MYDEYKVVVRIELNEREAARWRDLGGENWLRGVLKPNVRVPEMRHVVVPEWGDDAMKGWLDNCCIFRDSARTQVSDCYESYRVWAVANDAVIPSLLRFSMLLANRGYMRYRSGGVRYFIGIELKTVQAKAAPAKTAPGALDVL